MWRREKSSILWFAQLGNSHPSSSQSERSRFVLYLHTNALPFTPNKNIYLTKEIRISSLEYVMYLLLKGVYFIFLLEVQKERRLASSVTWQRLRKKHFCWVSGVASHSAHLPRVHHITHTDSTLAHTPFIIYPNFCFSGCFSPFVSEGASRCVCVCGWAVRTLCGRTVCVMWQWESWCRCQGRSGIDSCVCVCVRRGSSRAGSSCRLH